MEEELSELRKQIAELTTLLQSLQSQNETLRTENQLLQQKVQLLLKKIFGSKSEKFDPNQLQLLLEWSGDPEDMKIPGDQDDDQNDPPPSGPHRKRRKSRKPKFPEDIPTERIIIDPDEVKENPQDYKCIGEEVTEEYDVIPLQYLRRMIVRRKYKEKADRTRPPIVAPAPPRIVEGGYASPGLLTDIILKKYVDHLPLYRQEQILKERYGIDLSRKTMSDWVGIVANWLKPIYNHIGKELRPSGYLQVDETPIRFVGGKEGGSSLGYLWVYNNPAGNVLYEWHTGRGAECLNGMLDPFQGTVQCDGYSAYKCYASGRSGLELAGCWAHVRRKFFDAKKEEKRIGLWFLNQIQLLYRVEGELRRSGVSHKLRERTRAAESRMILSRLERALRRKRGTYLPQTQIAKAIAYTLEHWEQLTLFCQNGAVEIDNNLVENAIRPTALGKKNWMFVGHPDAGYRAAVIYTIMQTCRKYGINPQEYLLDVLKRLPTMKMSEVGELTPIRWAASRGQKEVAA